MTVISYLSVLRLIKLLKKVMKLFCSFKVSFLHISKLCLSLLWKCRIQRLYLIFNVLYKLPYTGFTMVYFQWIKNISICKKSMYTKSMRYKCLYLPLFSLYLPPFPPIRVSCGFFKTEFFGKKVKPLIFVTFNIITRHAFFWKFLSHSSSNSKDMKIFFINVNFFHQHFLYFSMLQIN